MKNTTTRYFGKYRGTVASNVDPELRARLQAVVPDVLGTQPTTWAMPAAPYAGPGAGFVALPPVGAGVWIEFEQGDPDFPIWSGGWWGAAGELPAPAPQPGGNHITLVTPGKHAVTISDVSGPTGGVSLRTASGARITVNDTGIVIDNGQGASITLSGNTVHIAGVMV
jgi:uncharacterized protein involved in type VI secretion and phage assembly